MTPTVSMRKALSDAGLLKHVIAGNSWRVWRILLIAAMGEQLTEDEREIFTRVTGREHEPNKRVSELEVIAGRRGGKTMALAALATYIAALCDHRDTLAAGETGVCLCLAQDQRIAMKILDFVEQNLQRSPVLAQLIVSRSQDTLQLKNNITIESRPASFRKLRGPTYIAVLADELAFWFVDDYYVNPDVEILAAAKPGLMTTHGPLIMASSPYAKKGVLYDIYRRHYGPNGSPAILVAKGTTRDFNPTIAQEEIDAELEKDCARNTAEYLAEFRADLEAFVNIDAVEACIARNVYERAPQSSVSYRGFVDPSGGSGTDSMTLAIGHFSYSKQTVMVDAIREVRPPFSPEQVTQEFAALLKTYKISKVVGDKFAGGYPPEQFGRFSILFDQAAKPRSDLYIDLLPLINSRRIELLDHPRLLSQLVELERRSVRGGRDSIDHPPNAHDDVVNAVAGLASVLINKSTYNLEALADPNYGDPTPAEVYRKKRLHPHFTDEEYLRISRPVGRIL